MAKLEVTLEELIDAEEERVVDKNKLEQTQMSIISILSLSKADNPPKTFLETSTLIT